MIPSGFLPAASPLTEQWTETARTDFCSLRGQRATPDASALSFSLEKYSELTGLYHVRAVASEADEECKKK